MNVKNLFAATVSPSGNPFDAFVKTMNAPAPAPTAPAPAPTAPAPAPTAPVQFAPAPVQFAPAPAPTAPAPAPVQFAPAPAPTAPAPVNPFPVPAPTAPAPIAPAPTAPAPARRRGRKPATDATDTRTEQEKKADTLKAKHETAVKYAKYIGGNMGKVVENNPSIHTFGVWIPVPADFIPTLKLASQRMGIELDGVPSDVQDYDIGAFFLRALGLTEHTLGDIYNRAANYVNGWEHPSPRRRAGSSDASAAKLAGYNEAFEAGINALMKYNGMSREQAIAAMKGAK